jgi:hypothetical protein
MNQFASASNQNVVVGNLAPPLVLTATATSLSSVTDPSTGITTNTSVTPLFTVVETVPPGVGVLPFFLVTVVAPPLTLSGQALTFTVVVDPVTMVQTIDAVTPTFTLHATVTPTSGNYPIVTITLTIP